jgi:hypothetical protein
MKLIAGKMNVLRTVCKAGYDESYKKELNSRKATKRPEMAPVIKVRKAEGLIV